MTDRRVVPAVTHDATQDVLGPEIDPAEVAVCFCSLFMVFNTVPLARCRPRVGRARPAAIGSVTDRRVVLAVVVERDVELCSSVGPVHRLRVEDLVDVGELAAGTVT